MSVLLALYRAGSGLVRQQSVSDSQAVEGERKRERARK